MLIGLSIAAATLISDQLLKYLILNYVLETYPYVKMASFFNIVNAWNTGVSFSMFSSGSIAGKFVLSTVALVIVAMLVWWLSKEKNKLLQVALGLIIGGALGNVVDRIRLGAVFDFLDFHISGYHWPAFNLADSAICVGAAIILIEGLFLNKKEEVKK
uniref:Lipoprotein signal peptidase n=1 Tax=uncultured Alphaproteobacteria bacterium TaxID=91750 RepID=A0A6G8F350_9PROT|nr:lipoprotein signal peptidase [uncultured Alphaproteobacteria bacterium]